MTMGIVDVAFFCRQGACRPVSYEHIDIEPNQFPGQSRQSVVIALCPAELDEDIPAFDPTKIAKSCA
jgi:hypothetical protein